MHVTKLEHAALRIDAQTDTLLIDPGSFLTPLDDLAALVAIVITHEHSDHWTPAQLERLLKAAPAAVIYAPEGVARAAEGFDVHVVRPGDTVTVGAFTLRFFGGDHAVIHPTVPAVENVGVLVNDELYYPGDSYTIPEGVEVQILAAPLGAPWLKISEAMDFVTAVRPRRAFGTHDITLSVVGKKLHHPRLQAATEQAGGEYHELEPGDSLDS